MCVHITELCPQLQHAARSPNCFVTVMFSQPQNVQQVVPAVVQLLQQLPSVWLAGQTGPRQVQADFTQVMLDLRRSVIVEQ